MDEQIVERKPYTEPELVEYGDLITLTQGTSGANTDTLGGSLPV